MQRGSIRQVYAVGKMQRSTLLSGQILLERFLELRARSDPGSAVEAILCPVAKLGNRSIYENLKLRSRAKHR